jgi:hypothetical protein
LRTRDRKGITLSELIITLALMSILTVTVIFVFNLHFKSWNESYGRSLIRGRLSQALEVISDNLRHAQSIDAISDSSLTFTADVGSGPETYRLYLYSAEDPEPNPSYTQDVYSLRLARGSINYGDGAVLSSDIAQPAGPVFTMSGPVIAIDLSAVRGDQRLSMRSKIRPRNL